MDSLLARFPEENSDSLTEKNVVALQLCLFYPLLPLGEKGMDKTKLASYHFL